MHTARFTASAMGVGPPVRGGHFNTAEGHLAVTDLRCLQLPAQGESEGANRLVRPRPGGARLAGAARRRLGAGDERFAQAGKTCRPVAGVRSRT